LTDLTKDHEFEIIKPIFRRLSDLITAELNTIRIKYLVKNPINQKKNQIAVQQVRPILHLKDRTLQSIGIRSIR